MPYESPHILSGPLGNNAFSYDIRTNQTLFIPQVREGDLSDVRIGSEIVFEDVDETGVLRSCAGLAHFFRTTWHDIPVIVFDNHNHALYFWYEALTRRVISHGSTLVHIDEHSDLWENSSVIPAQAGVSWKLLWNHSGQIPKSAAITVQNGIDLNEIFHFTNYSCNVGNYIQPALRDGIIGKIIRIEWEGDMERCGSYVTEEGESLILNLDLDFFAPELDYIPFESKKACILHFARQARLITIATSPFFIDQNRAIEMMKKVFVT